MRTLLCTTLLLSLASLDGLVNSAQAQSAPAASAATAASGQGGTKTDEEILQLSPFNVSTDKDTGYIAADTISAGRLSTNLLTTPGNFDVMTRDFLNDLGVFNTDEAAGWMTNSRPLELGAIESNVINPASLNTYDSGTNVSFRGMGSQAGTRNYFLSASTPKEYNVERMEASRGPNAILYGEGGPGGQVNYVTKRAQKKNFTIVRLRTDSLGSMGAALDFNRRLRKDLELRYNANWLDKEYHIERSQFKEVDHALNLVYHPFRDTTVTFDADFTRDSRPGLIMSYADQFSKWNRVPVTSKRTTAQATAAGLTNWSATAPSYVWIEGLGLVNMSGWPRTTGFALPTPTESLYGDAIFPGVSMLVPPSRKFNANPKDTDVKDRSRDLQLTLEHVFPSRLSIQLAGQFARYIADGGNNPFSNVYVDPMAVLPDGSANPNYGHPFSYSFSGRTVRATRESKSLRAVAAYPVKFLGGTTNFSVFAQHQEQDSSSAYYELHMVDSSSTLPITNTASQIKIYRYWDRLPRNLPDFTKLYKTVNVPTAQGITVNKNDAVMIAASGSYLEDKLNVIAGFRRDKSDLKTRNGDTDTRDTVSGQFTSYTEDKRVAYNNTLTTGVVYFPIKTIGFFANRAEGFTIQTSAYPHLDGSFAKANIIPARDLSYGLRFQVVNKQGLKIVGSVSHYSAIQKNNGFTINVATINQLWHNHGFDSKYINTFSADPLSTAATNAVLSSRSYEGYGWEAAITANVGNSFRLMVNGSLPKTRQSDVGADYIAYVNANMATWSGWVAQTVAQNPTQVSDSAQLTSIKQVINNFQDGRSQNSTYKYRYNVMGVYTFQGPALKGLRVGLGTQFYGKSIIGNELDRPYDYVYARAYNLASANLGYSFRIKKQKVDLQLNVDNLFNYDKPIYNGLFIQTLTDGSRVNVPYGFKYVWPRAARLTTTVTF